MPLIAWILTLLLLVLHQDWWLWDNPTLLFGFLPVGLGWHVGISLAAAVWWWVVVWKFWPPELDEQDFGEAGLVEPGGHASGGGPERASRPVGMGSATAAPIKGGR